MLHRLEARWLHASAAENTCKDHVKHPVHGSNAKVKRAEEAVVRIKSEYEAKCVSLQGQLHITQQSAAQAAAAAVAKAEAETEATAAKVHVVAEVAAAHAAAATTSAES